MALLFHSIPCEEREKRKKLTIWYAKTQSEVPIVEGVIVHFHHLNWCGVLLTTKPSEYVNRGRVVRKSGQNGIKAHNFLI